VRRSTGGAATSAKPLGPMTIAQGAAPAYSIVIPTFRRPDQLAECLACVAALDYALNGVEVIVIDNGGPAESSESAADSFRHRLAINYIVNPQNGGYGYSVNRGIAASAGARIVLLNDDARVRPEFLRQCDAVLDADPRIGCLGCRADEDGYRNAGGGIGRLDQSGEVVGNFNLDCGAPIEVEHIYGFCYVFTREAVRRAGPCDETLLARRYSSGNRIETDHCLSIRRHGLKVVYDPRIIVRHLAKPRPDISEVSLPWKVNAIRNTIYLYLKHFGPFGRGAAALRLTFVSDVGLLSMLKQPTRYNVAYFATGLRARASAYGHYLLYLMSRAGHA
jgi:GT2 family glycosyltransferase